MSLLRLDVRVISGKGLYSGSPKDGLYCVVEGADVPEMPPVVERPSSSSPPPPSDGPESTSPEAASPGVTVPSSSDGPAPPGDAKGSYEPDDPGPTDGPITTSKSLTGPVPKKLRGKAAKAAAKSLKLSRRAAKKLKKQQKRAERIARESAPVAAAAVPAGPIRTSKDLGVESALDGPAQKKRESKTVAASADPVVWNETLRLTFRSASPKPALNVRVFLTRSFPSDEHVLVARGSLVLDSQTVLICGVPLLFVDFKVWRTDEAIKLKSGQTSTPSVTFSITPLNFGQTIPSALSPRGEVTTEREVEDGSLRVPGSIHITRSVSGDLGPVDASSESSNRLVPSKSEVSLTAAAKKKGRRTKKAEAAARKKTSSFKSWIRGLGKKKKPSKKKKRRGKNKGEIEISSPAEARQVWDGYMAHVMTCLAECDEAGAGEILSDTHALMIDPARHLVEVQSVGNDDIMTYFIEYIGAFHGKIELAGFDTAGSTLRAGQAARMIDLLRAQSDAPPPPSAESTPTVEVAPSPAAPQRRSLGEAVASPEHKVDEHPLDAEGDGEGIPVGLTPKPEVEDHVTPGEIVVETPGRGDLRPSETSASGSTVKGVRIMIGDEPAEFIGRFDGPLTTPVGSTSGRRLPHGRGLMVFPNGLAKYEGSYDLGKRTGLGRVSLMSDDCVYMECRRWTHDMPVGVCHVSYRDSVAYDGHVKIDSRVSTHNFTVGDILMHGHGKQLNPGRQYFYYGAFVDHMRSGFGICDYLDKGERYVGMWANDKFEGEGCYCYVDGSVYVGTFKDGRRFREGTYYLSNGYLIKGKWTSANRIEKISLHEGKFEMVSDHLLAIVEAEIKRNALIAKTKSDEAEHDERNQLWTTLLKKEQLEDDMESLGDIWNTFDLNKMRKLIANEDGALTIAINFFSEYFCSLYALEAGSVKGHRMLLYAKDDVHSFIEFLAAAVFSTLKKFDPASWFDKGARGPGGGLLKSLGSVQHFAVAKGVGYMNRMKRGDDKAGDARMKKRIIHDLVLGNVHRKIFHVLFRLYSEEFREKELLLSQKTGAVMHALRQLPPGRKVKYLGGELKTIVTTNEWEELELGALSHLHKSVDTDTEQNEFLFLELGLKCLDTKMAKLKLNFVQEKDALERFSMPAVPDDKVLTKDYLLDLEAHLKSARIGIVCVTESSKVRKIQFLLDEVTSLRYPLDSLKQHSASLEHCYAYLQEYLLDASPDSHVIADESEMARLEAACLAVKAVEMDLTFFNLPSYARYVRTTKSVHTRLDSLKAHLRSVLGAKSEVLGRLEQLKKGKRSLIVDRAKKMDQELVRLCRRDPAAPETGTDLEFLLTRWRSLFRHIMSGYAPEERRHVAIIANEVESVMKELTTITHKPIAMLLDSVAARLKSVLLELRLDEKSVYQDKARSSILRERARTIRMLLEVLSKPPAKMDYCFELLRNVRAAHSGLLQSLTTSKVRRAIHGRTKEVLSEQQEALAGGDEPKFRALDATLERLKAAYQVMQREVSVLESIHLTQTFRTVELGTKALQLSVECKEVELQLEIIQKSLKVREVQQLMESTVERLRSSTVQEKVRTIENGMELRERDDQVQPFHLLGLGVSEDFIPFSSTGASGVVSPYSRSIGKLNELGHQRSIVDKIRVLKQLDVTIAGEMQEYSGKKLFEEDDILPIVLYVFLKSDLNHYAEYHYLSDWMRRGTMMLMRYDIFFKYVENLDPYARGKGGELLSVLGSILSPFKNAIFKAVKARPTNLSWLPNLFNYIYCEIGFLHGSTRLEIRNPRLREVISDNFELVQTLFVGGSIGFSIVLDLQAESKPVIEFHNVYTPNIYKWAAEEILKDFKDYMTEWNRK